MTSFPFVADRHKIGFCTIVSVFQQSWPKKGPLRVSRHEILLEIVLSAVLTIAWFPTSPNICDQNVNVLNVYDQNVCGLNFYSPNVPGPTVHLAQKS